MKSTKRKLEPIDWAFFIGGPALFLAIAWFGLQAIIGPGPAPSAIQKLKAGVITPGKTAEDVLKSIGNPKATVEKADGTYYFRYERSAWSGETKTFAEEDAYVDFDSTGRVTGVSFESRTPPPTPNVSP